MQRYGCCTRPMMKRSRRLISSGLHWQETPGWLRSAILRGDSEVGTVVHDEKQVISPAGDVIALRERAQCIAQLGSVGGLITGTEPTTSNYPDRAPEFEPVKSSFTREAGSSSRCRKRTTDDPPNR